MSRFDTVNTRMSKAIRNIKTNPKQTQETSLTLIAQALVDIDESLAILVDNLTEEKQTTEEEPCCGTCRFFDYKASPLDGPTGYCKRATSEFYLGKTRADFCCDWWVEKENKND